MLLKAVRPIAQGEELLLRYKSGVLHRDDAALFFYGFLPQASGTAHALSAPLLWLPASVHPWLPAAWIRLYMCHSIKEGLPVQPSPPQTCNRPSTAPPQPMHFNTRALLLRRPTRAYACRSTAPPCSAPSTSRCTALPTRGGAQMQVMVGTVRSIKQGVTRCGWPRHLPCQESREGGRRAAAASLARTGVTHA